MASIPCSFLSLQISGVSTLKVICAALLFLAITFIVVKQLNRRPYMGFGWFWYVGTLIPVIGIIQVGSQAMADRYTYIPLIGVFIMLAWGTPDYFRLYITNGGVKGRSKSASSILPLTACVIIVTFMVGTGCRQAIGKIQLLYLGTHSLFQDLIMWFTII